MDNCSSLLLFHFEWLLTAVIFAPCKNTFTFESVGNTLLDALLSCGVSLLVARVIHISVFWYMITVIHYAVCLSQSTFSWDKWQLSNRNSILHRLCNQLLLCICGRTKWICNSKMPQKTWLIKSTSTKSGANWVSGRETGFTLQKHTLCNVTLHTHTQRHIGHSCMYVEGPWPACESGSYISLSVIPHDSILFIVH